MEWLICKFTSIERGSFVTLQTTCLQEHSWNNSVNFTTFVTYLFAFWSSFVSFAKCKEVVASLGCDVAKQFKNDSSYFSRMCELHLCILSCLWVIEGFNLGLFRLLSVVNQTISIKIGKVVKCPLAKLFSITNVLWIVKEYEWLTCIMFIENSL